MNAFTDLFIRRPVLATVVSLLILLIGGMAGLKLQIRQFPETSNTTITDHDHLSRRRGRRDQGLHHDADRTGGREHRGHRHARLDLAAERLDDHPQPAPRRQSRPGDGRHALEGQPGARPAAARSQRSRRRQADRAGLRADVPVVQFERDDVLADHRLSHARRAAPPADGRRRRQCADPRRPDLRHAHLARSDPHGRARRHGQRRAQCARRQQFHHRGRRGEERLYPGQHRRADFARQRHRLRPARRRARMATR